MGYSVKWVEKHLGVSRKALRNFEKVGLMPLNKGGEYRNYTEGDIDRIWRIRLLQGVGYSLKEILSMANDENVDFESSLKNKIVELEAEKARIERYLGYAKAIKLTGRMPSKPKDMGSVTFEDFHEKSLEGWNINNNPEMQTFQKMTDLILNTSENEWADMDIDMGDFFAYLQELQKLFVNPEAVMAEIILPTEIAKRAGSGAADPEVQLLVKILYKNRLVLSSELCSISLDQFVRIESSSYKEGDMAKLKEREYGKKGCDFIADAIAFFGGYGSYDDVED